MSFKNSLLLTFIFFLSSCNIGGEGNNSAPVLASISNQTTNEDTAKTFTLAGTDGDAGDTLTYSATSSTANVTISVSAATLTLTPAANWNGSATITAKVNDGTIDSSSQTFTLTVSAVNDAPVLGSIANQTTNEATAKFVTLVGTDVDAGDILTYSATSSNADVVITVSGHTLTLTPNSDWNGSATITAKVNDGAVDSALQTFTLTVNEFTSGSTFKGNIYQTVTSPDTGRVWLDRNLGATQVCTSSTDTACYGYYYAWGRNDDGHELATSSITTTLATSISPATDTYIKNSISPNDWTSADSNGLLRAAAWANAGVNDICPAGFSVPTKDELVADTTAATTTDITNATTAFSSFLKLPVGGFRNGGGGSATYAVVGVVGYMWNRIAGTASTKGWMFAYNAAVAVHGVQGRGYGASMRCIKEL